MQNTPAGCQGPGHMPAPEYLGGQLYEAENPASTPGSNSSKGVGLAWGGEAPLRPAQITLS